MVGLVPCFLITWRAAVPEGLPATFDVKSPSTLPRRAILRVPTRAMSVWPKLHANGVGGFNDFLRAILTIAPAYRITGDGVVSSPISAMTFE